MAITPNDILEKEFSNKFRGYDPEQVNDYLDLVRVELEKTLEEKHNLSRELAEANDKIAYFSQLQESLNSSIIIAQEAAERLKQNARKEAELILYEAENEANRVINDANTQSNEIFSEAEKLRRVTKEYREELRSLIEGQLKIVDNTSFENLFDGTALTPAQPREHQPVASSRMDQLEDQSEVNDSSSESQSYQRTEEDVDMTQVFDLNDLRAIDKAELSEEENLSIPLSREELAAYERNQKGPWNESGDEEASSEDLHGKTIRIDLPSED